MRQESDKDYYLAKSVSIHAPARGATYFVIKLKRRSECFNPRTREGCDSKFLSSFQGLAVSIHAPARGATIVLGDNFTQMIVSIHAPARGATLKASAAKSEERVSIHAPARGATSYLLHPKNDIRFQSTHPRGVRRTNLSSSLADILFQSTHPRGVRPHIQKCIEYQYAKLCFLRHNAKLLKTRHIRHRRKRQPTDFQRLR